ncbi:MAG: hypothetical protein ACI9XO_003682 [Paraglaciecola sp.]|jgi:hypothetical protein
MNEDFIKKTNITPFLKSLFPLKYDFISSFRGRNENHPMGGRFANEMLGTLHQPLTPNKINFKT